MIFSKEKMLNLLIKTLVGENRYYLEDKESSIKCMELYQTKDIYNRNWIVCVCDRTGLIMGLLAFEESDNIYIDYVETSGLFLNKGVAKLMIKSLFDYADQKEIDIINSNYLPDGKKYLQEKKVFQKEALKHQIKFYEKYEYTYKEDLHQNMV